MYNMISYVLGSSSFIKCSTGRGSLVLLLDKLFDKKRLKLKLDKSHDW